MMRKLIFAGALALAGTVCEPSEADAGGRFRSRSVTRAVAVTRTAGTSVAVNAGATAQAKADEQARLGRCGHFSACPAGCLEGVGMSSAGPDAALANCCYTGRFPVIQQAVARGANGLWYAAKLFRPVATCGGGNCPK